MKEAKNERYSELCEYYNIKKKIGKNWRNSSSKLFLINKQWYYDWKIYINKDYFDKIHKLNPNKVKKEGEEVDESKLKFEELPSPGKISNDKILMNLDSFYNDGDKKNPENFIIKPDLGYNKDIKKIHEELWNFYFQKFGGGPELCLILNNNKNENQKDDLFRLDQYGLKLVFLPVKNEIIGNDEKIKEIFCPENIKSIYINKDKVVIDLIKKIVDIENKNLNDNKNNHYGEKVNVDEIKIWFSLLSEFDIQKLSSLMIYTYGKDVLDKALKENKDNMKEAKNVLINKKIDKMLFSPKELCYYSEENKTKIEEVFPDPNKQKVIIFIDRNKLNYFQETEYKDDKCSFCTKLQRLFYYCNCKKQWYCSKKCKNRHFDKHYSECPFNCLDPSFNKENIFSVKAICGLKNLGNTCYLNTAVQCLNSCWELTNYFLRKNIEKNINQDNPLGYKGILAKSYSNLIHHLWYGVSNVYDPTIFLQIIGHLNEMFSGKNQQDAQEFLNFLIDGLHEDLNLVKEKPTIQEEKIKSDKRKARIEWLNFKMRNQSILVKLFYGQFKSNISCPNQECQCTVTKYEPFMSVSVPLTIQPKKFDVTCFFVFYYTRIKPIKIELTFNNDYTLMALRNKISKILNVHPFSFVICKLDSVGNIKYYANFTQKISATSMSKINNEKPYFLLQLDPKIFNDPKNNSYKDLSNYLTKNFEKLNEDICKNQESIEKLFDYEYIEDEKGAPNQEDIPASYYQQINDEESEKTNTNKTESILGNIIVENYGINDKFILVPLYINEYSNSTFNNPQFFMFPRILLLNKDMTCKDIHKLVFKIFEPVIRVVFKKDREIDFKKVFNNLSTDMQGNYYENDTYHFHESSSYPYRLRIVNINKKKEKEIDLKKCINQNIELKEDNFCIICKRINCRNCLLPYDNEKLSNILKEYPKNNNKQTVDGTYYFLNGNQRKLIERNCDFQLEMTWLLSCKKIIFDLLNAYDGLNIKNSEEKKYKSIPLLKCFDYFMKWDKLENYSYKCELCKTDKNPSKQIQIYKCPYYLIIHLKRFIDNKNKINTEVIFPIRGLDLNNYVMDDNDPIEKIYDLRCIMYHSGNLEYGHYYAVCYNTLHNKWYSYNDNRVNEIKESEISTKDAYVLFYRRRGLESMLDLEKIYLKKFKDYSNKISNIRKTNTKNKDINQE